VLSELGQTAAVLVAVEVTLDKVLEAAAFALVPEAVTNPEAEEMAEEEDEEPVFEDEADDTTTLFPKLTREPER
jgi:hypothetical protein